PTACRSRAAADSRNTRCRAADGTASDRRARAPRSSRRSRLQRRARRRASACGANGPRDSRRPARGACSRPRASLPWSCLLSLGYQISAAPPWAGASNVPARRQRDERAAVALAKHAHQGCITRGGDEIPAHDLVVDRERHRVNPHAPALRRVRAVRAIDLPDDGVDRPLREVVAVDVDRYALLGIVEGLDRLENALARRGVRERVPVTQRVDDRLARRGRIRHPLIAIALEEVLALVVHHLYAVNRGVDIERLADLLLHAIPRVLPHAAGRIDHDDDVFAVDGNAADLVLVDRRFVIGEQALHLLGQLLLRLREPAGELGRDLRVVLPIEHLRADARELALKLRDRELLELDLVDDRRELAPHDLRLAENVLELLLIADHQALEIGLRLLEADRLEQLRDHEQQDDRTEAARHRVEERQAHRVELAALSASTH